MLAGHKVLDYKVLVRDGSFTKVRYWIAGYHDISSTSTSVKFIRGFTGPETEVTISIIMPSVKVA